MNDIQPAKDMGPATEPAKEPEPAPARQRGSVPIVIGAAVAAILATGGLLVWRASASVNQVALSSSPKPVTVVHGKRTTFHQSRTYVGTLMPWVEANVGPQFISAYVDTVLVRPGAPVKRGQVLATLDCRNASAASQAIASQARAIEMRQEAMAKETSRTEGLLAGGFVSRNEIDRKVAETESDKAQFEAQKANLVQRSLEVGDCVLRAPFDGEVARRMIDPGAFVRPGAPIVTVVDRSIVRMTADAPEIDYDLIAPGTKVEVRIVAKRKTFPGTISRRTPSADPESRTVSFEADLADPERQIPAWTTGEAHLDVGDPITATEVPAVAASVRGSSASLFVLDGDVARLKTFPLLGETVGRLYLDPAFDPGARLVTEGRVTLNDGDRVSPKEEAEPPREAPAK